MYKIERGSRSQTMASTINWTDSQIELTDTRGHRLDINAPPQEALVRSASKTQQKKKQIQRIARHRTLENMKHTKTLHRGAHNLDPHISGVFGIQDR